MGCTGCTCCANWECCMRVCCCRAEDPGAVITATPAMLMLVLAVPFCAEPWKRGCQPESRGPKYWPGKAEAWSADPANESPSPVQMLRPRVIGPHEGSNAMS